VSRRIVIEEKCEHENIMCDELVCGHPLPHMPENRIEMECWCPGGSRTVLAFDEMMARAVGSFREQLARHYTIQTTGGETEARAILTAALFSSDAGGREET
jgi:hypothetical protein